MAHSLSKPPKERINITYKPDGEAQEEKELPFKILSIGDYTLREDDTPLEERKPINVSKQNFADVMSEQKLGLNFNVNDTLSGKDDSEFPVSLKIDSMKDFQPDSIARQIPELNELMEIRDLLLALKGPLGNVPAFRKQLQALVADDDKRDAFVKALGLD
ncbi:MAG: type VI secretion system contractile sheath small subunit [Gammaproteobacteria bacterium]